MTQLYPDPGLQDLQDPAREKSTSNEQGPAAAATAVLWVVFLTALAIAPAVVIATWKALL